MVAIVIVLYVLSGGLPGLALWQVWRQAEAALAGLPLPLEGAKTLGDLQKLFEAAIEAPVGAVLAAKRQFVLVGIGLACGVLAGILSLFLS